ncbi:MAG: hypothetical protein OES53_08835 [Xanthomonadales bacterium]|jgi:DNA-binding beta-propeller fold protein YncE|nr:hypothetical protein [Xanthomonadales bacterium]MDH3924937.1 hypothetical protein [Xanthomonadales bacterium]MDH3941656.1 hypothetical protein [Xanthomonadales bacterium]MDH4000095.1 hypothetical protein [Xanthomonadales bacterium]
MPSIRNCLTAAIISAICLSHAQAQPEVDIEFISSFGEFGNTDPGTFDWAAGVALDGQGRVIVADNRNHRIQRCTVEGDCEVIGERGRSPGQFRWPLGVAVDGLGRIVVSEAGNDRIQLLDQQGNWTSFGSNGLDGPPGKFRIPAGMTVDAENRIIIADERNHRVQICDDAGNCTAFGQLGSSPGMFDTPRDVALASGNRILVTDFWNHRIQICSYSGDCTAFGGLGTEAGKFNNPAGIAVDSQDRIIISESGNDRLQICDLSGQCTAYGGPGAGLSQFNDPQAVDVDENNVIYVGELENHRVQIFQAFYGSDQPVDSFQINPGLNDAWYNDMTGGQGFLITVFPDVRQLFLAWFTYDIERPPDDVNALLGEPGHRWLTALGPYEGNTAKLTIFVTEGGVFDSAVPVPSTDPDGDGILTIEFADCEEAMVSYTINSLGISGEIPIQRIVLDNVSLCETLSQ